ncbi:hypothetical protein P22_0635 [Propionispora sp. 2/2-37]|uniref:PTS glucitol/sorbitol transporter subunit IIA n=1 Tax=Propionispora sp. 2/2-37 TaxID=1677858 RepID=UPI0006BB7F12|nr:PTS glucitol/sorbitol transporter subunit IIA [Propionispora sp. 2/2-37]CUH94569.1 hypothetical protein P22_0635 [Propionispora sp. 2/2-37]
MKLIYQTRVTNIGNSATAFLGEKMIILFKDNAPEELADYCILHSGNQVLQAVRAGDILRIGNQEYAILYVGDEVEANLSNLGHITLRFNGAKEGLGGSIYLEDKVMPEIEIGDEIAIFRS